MTNELFDNKHIDFLTKLFHAKQKTTEAVEGEDIEDEDDESIDRKGSVSTLEEEPPRDVSEKAIQFVEEMKRRRYIY